MAGKRPIFDILSAADTPAADDALLAALPGAGLPTAQAIVETLLLRNTRRGNYGLIAAFHELDESLRQLVLGEMDQVFSVLREALQSREEQVRLNTLALIHRGCAYRAAYLVDAALHDHSLHVRAAAAETLHALADELLKTSPVPTADQDIDSLSQEEMRLRMADLESYAEDRRQVVAAIESGLVSFGLHLHPKVVEAAMWFIDDLGLKFWAVVAAPGSRAGRVALTIFSGAKDPRLVPFAIMALNYSEFRPQAARVLAACGDHAFLAEWLRQSWRIVQPKTAKGMAAIKELACIDNRATDLLSLPAGSQRHLARWIVASGIAEETKMDLLRELQRRGERATRRSAVWALTARDTDRSLSLLQTIAQGEERDLARIARHELARRRPLEYPPSELISIRSAGTLLDHKWSASPAAMSFDRYWSLFDRLSDEDRVKLGQEVLERTPAARGLLSRQLMEPGTSNRVRAIRIITVLDMANDFTDQLYRLCCDSHPEVRSACVLALGRVSDPAGRRLLHEALSDGDPRVQANAVEAIDLAGEESAAAALLPKLASDNNRVRANAVKALLKLGVREAAETLLRMLQDPDKAQRVSALWLINHMGLFTLASRVVRIGETDEDEQVRARAKELVERLQQAEADPPPAASVEAEVGT